MTDLLWGHPATPSIRSSGGAGFDNHLAPYARLRQAALQFRLHTLALDWIKATEIMTEDQAKKAANALHAVANPMRIRIFLALADEELMVGDLADRVRLSQSATSQHLKIMTGSGILVFRKDAQRRYYTIEPSIGETVRKLVSIALNRETQLAKR